MSNTEPKKAYPRVENPFTPEMLKSFPKATPNSTPEEMRKICLDFMRLQLSFRWVPSEDFEYVIRSAKRPVKLSTDTVYAGLPYVNLGSGSIYRVAEFIDPETGVFDISELKEDPQILGNACTGAACIAWARCISSAKMTYTSGMTQLMGYVNVGPYSYMKELPLFIKGPYTIKEDPQRLHDYTAHNIGLEMGREVMLECYAALKPADGVHSRGHVRMVSDVHVERDENGNVDGEKSYILYMDQVGTPYNTEVIEKEDGTKERIYHTDLLQEDGTPVYVQGGIDIKVDFDTLFKKHYIPFTFKEFIGEKKYEKALMRTNGILRTTFNTEHLKEIVLTANYPISDAFITVTSKEGKLLYKDVYRYRTHHRYDAPLKSILKLDELKQFENGENTLDIQFQLYNGTLIKSWKGFNGTLCPGKTATELEEDDLNVDEKLKAIPIAKEGMTPEELRKICVDFMKLQLSFPYKISEDLNYWVERQNHKVYWKKEEVHAGIPYVNVGSGSIYRWMEYYDPKTGVVDLSELGRNKRVFGNACSGGCATSWARCITSVPLGWTHQMTQARGVIPVGPYTYRKDIESFSNPEKYTAKTVCLENGEQTMFESYALLQPADGLNNPGHIRMATGIPTVVRREDGSIDGEKSFAIYSDQVMVTFEQFHARQQKCGDWYVTQGGVDAKISFKELYDTGYLPFTFKEFLGQASVPKALALPNIRKINFNVDELREISVKFNFPMSDAFYTITDVNGKLVMDGVWRTPQFATYEIPLWRILPLNEMKLRLEPFEGPYVLEIQFQLYNGQRLKGINGFKGNIIPGKEGTSTTVHGKNLAEQLKAIPIAKPGMRDFRLRQICLDYMKLQCQFPHILSEDVNYVIISQKKPRPLHAGMVHGGLPYVTAGSGNLYRVLEALDPETGVLDASMDCIKYARYFGNACSGGVGTSWSRVINSANFCYTKGMTKKNGFLPIGPYRYDTEIEEFYSKRSSDGATYNPRTICQDNGEQTMFESYALMIPADGVVNTGHVRMNSAYPHVVRNEDGTIDGEKSYTLMTEQVCYATHPNHTRIHPDGTHYTAMGFVDMKYSFKNLFDTYYIPFTFKEFIGEKEVEEGKVEVSCQRHTVFGDHLENATLSSNFPISDVFTEITDANNNVVFRHVYRSPVFFCNKMKLGDILPLADMHANAGNHIRITCQLYNGEKLVAFDAAWKA